LNSCLTGKAQKYKQYNRLRDIVAGKLLPPPAEDERATKKRKAVRPPTETPIKRTRHDQTPNSSRAQRDAGLFATPSISRKLFSPATVTSVGPTPQRDGRVLGLFDLLAEKELKTPSKKVGMPKVVEPQTLATPRKGGDPVDLDRIELGRTPRSAGKHPLLDAFWTPLKKTDGNSQSATTPSSHSKLHFSTPAFLKRNPLPPVDENDEFESVPPARLPRKPLVRGLSAIVASLRKVEEEKLDDDLEALREMEEAENPNPRPKPQPAPAAAPAAAATTAAKEQILAADSQAGQLPLGGFDDEGMYDSPTEEQLDTNGQPLRIFKKKGQKRTTKRVNMKPVRAKRPAGSYDEAEDEAETVPETQVPAGEPTDPDAEFKAAEESASEAEARTKKKKKKKPAKEAKKSDGPVKKAARKVNELAHANFKRLKLKNSGAKGKPGFNSKFRRRR